MGLMLSIPDRCGHTGQHSRKCFRSTPLGVAGQPGRGEDLSQSESGIGGLTVYREIPWWLGCRRLIGCASGMECMGLHPTVRKYGRP